MKQKELELLIKNGVKIDLILEKQVDGYYVQINRHGINEDIYTQRGDFKSFSSLDTAEKWCKKIGCINFNVWI